jgi:DNA polymerase II small subunit/DNA polymerase delta subunit B
VKAKEESLISLKDIEVGELLKEVQGRGYFIARTPVEQSGQVFQGDLKRWNGRKYRFGVVSDTHLCSRYQQLTALWDFYRLLGRRHINTCFNCGDVVDGMGVYRGQDFETFVHGADGQTEYAIDHYPKVKGVQTHVISGNHDLSFMATAGYNVVRKICEAREDMTFVGDYLAYIMIDTIKIALMHGAGANAYARSYKIQKVVENFSSESKPHFLFLGHYHVPNITPGYRNCESIQMSAFQAQTPYLATKGLQPWTAGLIVEIQTDDSGLAKVQYEWIPFYKPKKNDF